LKLARAQLLADDQIIRAVIPQSDGAARQCTTLTDNKVETPTGRLESCGAVIRRRRLGACLSNGDL
jgi:hypothetical protein